MLNIKRIKKEYHTGDQVFHALKGVSMSFPKQSFVSILGESGSGKTTLLNIIGGLDQYTKGDLEIQGVSTTSFKDADWDAYRNTTIGFVFQSYNLISHLSVIDNVDMSLRLINVSTEKRLKKVKAVLKDVGLEDHMYKKPSQLSGGQQQRVAIARALVNDPKILLADEPTGALDSVTSEQIMTLIKRISKGRLVIMVTHSQELAHKYSDRIIELKDGEVIKDSKPVDVSSHEETYRPTKVSMSFFTAMKSSFQNLLTKKTRTLITTLAGSIGIIGVALVLALSNGMTSYVSEIESDSLAGFPVSVSDVISTNEFGPNGEESPFSSDDMTHAFPDDKLVYAYDEEASTTLHDNIITEDFLMYIEALDESLYHSISYTQAIQMNAIIPSGNDTFEHVSFSNQVSQFNQTSMFNEMPNSEDFVLSQYDLLDGVYPTSSEDIVMFVDEQNRIDIRLLEMFGLTDLASYTFDELLGLEIYVIPNDVFYEDTNGIFTQTSDLKQITENDSVMTLTITSIMRVKEEATSDIIGAGIGYQSSLTTALLEDAKTSEIVEAQKQNPNISILTGLPFSDFITYDDTLGLLGGNSMPIGLEIYPSSFEAKDTIKAYLDDYNEGKLESDVILYTDTAELISSTITGLIDTITIVLTALAAVSLVVSSIMIGIITYVSVVERTKEIGIMRSLGARKKDIRRIFNAETLLIGLFAGVLGIVVTILLSLPANTIIENLIGVENIVQLTTIHAVSLITLSAILTLLAGLIPSGIAAKRDPVLALRSE